MKPQFVDVWDNPVKPPKWWQKVHLRFSSYGCAVRDGKLLMLKLRQNKRYELPGGGLELKEYVADSLRREFKEETGFDVLKIDDQPIYVTNNLVQFFYNKKYYNNVYSLHRVTLSEEAGETDLQEYEDVQEMRWVPLEELSEETVRGFIWPGVKALLEQEGLGSD